MLRTTLLVLPALLTGSAVADAQATGQRVKANGMQMYYEVSGQGDPLIVLHGAYMNIPLMGTIVSMLAKTHRVYALELQGHGRTTDIDRAITYQNLADDVAAFMDAVVLRSADVFGYSMGAMAGLQLAIRRPAKVGKLVFGSIKSPVLIIAGDADGMNLEHAVAMFHLLGGGVMGDMGKPLSASRHAILPATSHTAIVTQPDVLIAFVEPFLKGVTPKGMFEK